MSLTHKDIGVWLINLDRAAQRRAQMKSRLSAINLSYNVFSAVDGRVEAQTLAHTVDEAAYERNMGSKLLPGKIGCYHSHLRTWQNLLNSPYEVALILEDDIVFHDYFLKSVDVALSVIDDWDTVRFNSVRAKFPKKIRQVGTYQLNAYFGPFTGNGAYLIKRDVAARLLPNLLPMTRAFDHELNRFFVHNYRQMGLEPWSSHIDDEGISMITGSNKSDLKKLPFLKRIPNLFLKCYNYVRRFIFLMKMDYFSS